MTNKFNVTIRYEEVDDGAKALELKELKEAVIKGEFITRRCKD